MPVFDGLKENPATPDQLAENGDAVPWRSPALRPHSLVEPQPKLLSVVEPGEIFTRDVGINLRIFVHPAEAERWLRYG